MNSLLKLGCCALTVFFLACADLYAATADPEADLAESSVFGQVDLGSVAGGEMLAAKGPALEFERGLAAETCFLVRIPMDKAVAKLRTWTPAGNRALHVVAHGAVSRPPAAGDFRKLGDEAKRLPTPSVDSADPVAFWTNLLSERASSFQSGGLAALPPYPANSTPISVKNDAERLLKELPKVNRYFAPILRGSGIAGAPSDPACYWESVVEDDKPALILGAVTVTRAHGGWQALDLQYFATGGFFVGMTFYQLWPVSVAGENCTLIWRCNAVSAPEVATLGDAERRMAGVAYKNRVRKYAEALRDALEP